eukprot:3438033-Rhodomonas_salina.2
MPRCECLVWNDLSPCTMRIAHHRLGKRIHAAGQERGATTHLRPRESRLVIGCAPAPQPAPRVMLAIRSDALAISATKQPALSIAFSHGFENATAGGKAD